MCNKRVLVIIPAYNEEKNLYSVIDDLKVNAPECDYIIINDCSTDKTIQLCKDKKFNYLSLPSNLGIGGCVQTGYKYAKENNYDIAIQFDGDGQHNAKYIENFIEKIDFSNIDMVIGSRFLDKEGFQSSFSRRLGIKFFNKLIKLVTHNNITDPTSGFRAVNKGVIDSFCNYYPKDYPEPESIVRITRQGYKVGEIPVIMKERINGESSINIYKSVYYMIKVSLAILIDALRSKNTHVSTKIEM